jgi:hypothetical protein
MNIHHQHISSSKPSESAPSNSIPPPKPLSPEGDKKELEPVLSPPPPAKSLGFGKSKAPKDDIELDFTLKSPDVIMPPPTPEELPTDTSPVCNSEKATTEAAVPQDSPTASDQPRATQENNVIPDFDSPPHLNKKGSVQRSLDFSDSIDSEDLRVGAMDSPPTELNEISTSCNSQLLPEEFVEAELGIRPIQQDSPVGPERERMEVRVLVHKESRDDSSFGSASDDEDPAGPQLSSVSGYTEHF